MTWASPPNSFSRSTLTTARSHVSVESDVRSVRAVVPADVAFGQANGKLQIHYIDVGQGDGAVLISPLGQVVLFDNGVLNQCQKPVAFLQALGITKIDYHIASHYHSDHIGWGAGKHVHPSDYSDTCRWVATVTERESEGYGCKTNS